jgi:hypothetical protein
MAWLHANTHVGCSVNPLVWPTRVDWQISNEKTRVDNPTSCRESQLLVHMPGLRETVCPATDGNTIGNANEAEAEINEL